MDIGIFAFGSVIVLAMGLLSIALKREDIAPLFAFIGFILGMLFFTSLNTDGSITNAYAYTSSFQTSTVSIWPLAYILLLLMVLDAGIGITQTIGKVRF